MKYPPDLSELAAFEAVARHRSFRKAADERGVSASALSHALRGLEERLGLRLLHRSTRSVTPTEAGEHLLARLKPALREVGDALSDLAALKDEPAGTLRLNVPRMVARVLFTPLLGRFVAAYPRVRVEIATDDALLDIVSAGFDAGIRFGESLAGDMVAVPIGPAQQFLVVASPEYVAAHGEPGKPGDLLAHACIGRRFPSGNLYAWEFVAQGQPLRVTPDGPLILDDDVLILQAARDGAGIAYTSESLVREDLSAGRLVELLRPWRGAPERAYLYYPGRRHVPPALRALIEMLNA